MISSMGRMMGIIFSNLYDEELGELTKERAMASVPFGGRYRIIDFVLSSMVNSGISNVGVITKANYQSLMDHLGKGKEWDLDRKKDGLFILPPFGAGQKGIYSGKLDAMCGAIRYIERSTEEYVLISDSNSICNMDYVPVLESHLEQGADITVITRRHEETSGEVRLAVKADGSGRIIEAQTDCEVPAGTLCDCGMYILKRKFLIELLNAARERNEKSFRHDVVEKRLSELDIRSFEFKGRMLTIDSVSSFFEHNMSLLNKEVRDEIFSQNGEIYTKIRDEVPALYGDECKISRTLVSDGCVIDGTVENSIISRGVTVKRGAVVRNSIIMQDSEISESAVLDTVIIDKDVMVTAGKEISGRNDCPLIIRKGETV